MHPIGRIRVNARIGAVGYTVSNDRRIPHNAWSIHATNRIIFNARRTYANVRTSFLSRNTPAADPPYSCPSDPDNRHCKGQTALQKRRSEQHS